MVPDDVPAGTAGKPKQCICCLGNESKSYAERTLEYSTLNKMGSRKYCRFGGELDCALCWSDKVTCEGALSALRET